MGLFGKMLHAVEDKFEGAPHEAVEELDQTIESLQRMKRSLEESTEFREAQALKEQAAKKSRVKVLEETVEDAKTEVERLLGYSLQPFHYQTDLYGLLPDGYVDRGVLSAKQAEFKQAIHTVEAHLKEISVLHDAHRSFAGNKEQAMQQQLNQISGLKSRLLGFLMRHKPMDAQAFRAQLTPHLDVMVDALSVLRELQ